MNKHNLYMEFNFLFNFSNSLLFWGLDNFFLESGTVGKKAMVSNSSGFRAIEKHPWTKSFIRSGREYCSMDSRGDLSDEYNTIAYW